MIALIIAFALYAGMLLAIGAYSYAQVRSSQDFLLGDRNINYWITAISAHASDMSSWLFFGLPAAVYAQGLMGIGIPLGLLGGMWVTWHFIAPRLRTSTEKSGSMTLTHFVAHAAHAKNHTLIVVSSLLLVFFFVFYLAVGLKGIGTVLEFAFGIDYLTGVILSALIIMIYTMLGGYVAVALTDACQGIFLLAMIILVPLITWWRLPAAKLASIAGSALVPTMSTSILWGALINAFAWGLGYLGMPHMLTKFMSIDSVKNMKKAQYVGLSWQTLALGSSTAIGLLARGYFTVAPSSGETLFMQLVIEQFTPLLAGFILCAILAATISTLDAQLIVCATVITRDLCQPRNSVAQVRITRTSIALLTGCAVMIAAIATQSLHELTQYAWSGLGATFGPVVVMSLFARHRLTHTGAIAGMLIGGLTAAFWPHYGSFLQSAPLIPGFASGLAIIWTCSVK